VSFEELMFLLQNSVDVLAPLSSALSELIFQAAARPHLLINLARPPSSLSHPPHQLHSTSSTSSTTYTTTTMARTKQTARKSFTHYHLHPHRRIACIAAAVHWCCCRSPTAAATFALHASPAFADYLITPHLLPTHH
jgi:hypothetical protein